MSTIQENRLRWVEALESGAYQQGKSYLNSGNAFCCLGVLCDLHKDDEDVKGAWVALPDENQHQLEFFSFGHYNDEFPDETIFNKVGITLGKAQRLADMNDEGKSFREIAKLLREDFSL